MISGVALLTGCSGTWGTPAHVAAPDVVDDPVRGATFVGPRGAPLPPGTIVEVSEDPPPVGSVAIAIVRAGCDPKGDYVPASERCLEQLTDEARAAGADAIYGFEEKLASGRSLARYFTGSAVRKSSEPSEPKTTLEGTRTVTFGWDRVTDEARYGLTRVILERKVGVSPLSRIPPYSGDDWQPVCELPCEVTLDPRARYVVRAPQLPNEPPIPIDARDGPTAIRAAATAGPPRYRNVYFGIGSVVVGAGLTAGMIAFSVNALKHDDTTDGAGGLSLLAIGVVLLVGGAYMIVDGPERDLGLAVTPAR